MEIFLILRAEIYTLSVMRFFMFRFFILIFCLAPLFSFYGCEGAVPADLDRAAKVIRFMSEEYKLEKTSFPALYPNCLPSEFVKWVFSEKGKAEWPDSLDNDDSNPDVRNKAFKQGAPIVPRSVQFFAGKTDPNGGRQLIVKANDAARTIIVEGYGDPKKKPDLKREWDLPLVKQVSKFELNKY